MFRFSLLFSLFPLLIACEGAPSIPISQLELSPGCYTPFVSGSCDGVTSSTTALAVCEAARLANRERETSLFTSLRPFVMIVDTMRASPDQQQWVTNNPISEGTIIITADQPQLDAGVFRIEFMGPQQSEVIYANYNPNATAIDLRHTVLRWSPHAIEVNSLFRGCDPDLKISWDTRYSDDGVFETICWDSSGLTNCDRADLWPR